MGRRSKLTDERQARIMELIRQGCPQGVAARRSGLSERQFYDWCARGRAARSGKYHDFWNALEQAQAIAEATLVLRMQVHAQADWRAAAWMLERRFPDRWKQHKAVEQTVTTPEGTPARLIVQLGDLDPAQLSALSGVDLDGMGLPTDGPDNPPEPIDDDG